MERYHQEKTISRERVRFVTMEKIATELLVSRHRRQSRRRQLRTDCFLLECESREIVHHWTFAGLPWTERPSRRVRYSKKLLS
jgi:hypothetical protein